MSWLPIRLAALAVSATAVLAAAGLEPFRMPWDDASPGITNLQGWQPDEAGIHGWVQVTPAGHYAVDSHPIRFLGVNVAAASAMPTHARAEAHAARLARFGFNAVRLHHLEAPWQPDSVLIDYASGSSRNLSQDRLDKLQYFVAQLASHGIYSDVNLLVSRQFMATDGLGAEVTQMDYKIQHILGFFNDTALALHKEHATKLLTAPNPYRNGVPLGLDPAVAFVEIMNENGLMEQWLGGAVDKMPSVYQAQLQARWNQWLAQRYANTAALLSGWGTVDQPLGSNLLTNGSFASGAAGWNCELHDPAAATFTGTSDFNGASALKIVVTRAGSASWHVQLNQSPLTLTANGFYTVSFWARADQAVPLYAGLSRAYGDWGGIGNGLNLTLGATWQEYTMTLQNGAAESNARVNFGGFGDRLCTVWLADVRVQPGGRIGGLPAGVTLEAANIPSLLLNPTSDNYSLGQRQDWTRCILSLEAGYWNAMARHLKTTLGYPGIVWGTIISNSPPNAQAGLDAFDSHAYWQHPTWPPGDDWNPETWTIPNTSMVNDAAGGTIGGIARQQVQGKPHNVTEYQHPSPNSYTSEGPVLAAAYAALQDWDSLWLFAYETTEAEFVTGFFDHGTHPGRLANNLLAATLFRRGDVATAVNEYTMALTPDKEVEVATSQGVAWNIADGSQLGVPASLALASRVSLSIGTGATGLARPPAAPAGSAIASDTGELLWDNSHANEGVVTVNATRTKAVFGYTDGRSWDLGGVQIAPGATRHDWCTIGLTLLEGGSFDSTGGGRALIVATGDLENTNQQWKDATHTSLGSNWGAAPTLIEVVPATVTLPVASSRVTAWALDGCGQRATPLTVTDSAGQARLTLGNSGTTLWYEIVIAADDQAFLQRLFRDVLGREIDPGALSAYLAALSGGRTRAGVYGDLVGSAEYAAWQVEPVIRLYYAAFARMPDHGGLQNWSNALRAGVLTLTGAAGQFASSTEFLLRYGSLNNTQYVQQLYRNVLGREADTAGLADWVGQLDAGASRGAILVGFSESDEFKGELAGQVEILRLYYLLLQRMPTAAELQDWIGFLKGYGQTDSIYRQGHPSGMSNASYVTLVFQGFLRREVDAAALSAFGAALAAGTATHGSLVEAVMNSDEFNRFVAPAARLYLAALRRVPDQPGLDNWVNYLRSGTSLQVMADAFASSQEFINRYGAMSNGDYVAQLYRDVLGREGDAAGLAHWTGLLGSGGTTRGQILIGFSESQEAVHLLAPTLRTFLHYFAFLNTAPAQPDLDYWKNCLATLDDQMREDLLAGL
jgi:hypothetical protein